MVGKHAFSPFTYYVRSADGDREERQADWCAYMDVSSVMELKDLSEAEMREHFCFRKADSVIHELPQTTEVVK